VRELTFEAPDLIILRWLCAPGDGIGGAAPALCNAADEVAVAEFIAGDGLLQLQRWEATLGAGAQLVG
jgi:1-deoxy-D-xylulose 5-phosphate reductoisomerase